MKNKRKIIGGGVFLALFLISFVMQMLIDNEEILYDASLYWEYGKALRLDIRNETLGFRGYFLLYFFSMCYQLGTLFGKEFSGYWILSSLIFALTFSVVFFMIAKILEFSEDDNYIIGAGGISGILFLLFFRGLFIYPLSDFCMFHNHLNQNTISM